MTISATTPVFSVITDAEIRAWYVEMEAAVEALQVAGGGGAPVNVTTTPLAVSAASHGGRTVTLNKADGVTATLPAATGSGVKFKFIVGTAASGGNYVIQVTGNDTMTGNAVVANDTDDSASIFQTASDSDTITLNGTTKGGLKGDIVELEDIAADLWSVRITSGATGSEASPFSAAV